jgi:hypothetical protein
MSFRFQAAYVTLLTNSNYLPGTLVLDHCLRSVQSKYPLVVMVTPQLPEDAKKILRNRQIDMHEVDTLLPAEGVHKLSDADARFHDTWTKLRSFFGLALPQTSLALTQLIQSF